MKSLHDNNQLTLNQLTIINITISSYPFQNLMEMIYQLDLQGRAIFRIPKHYAKPAGSVSLFPSRGHCFTVA
jgi:hypothetical protein